MDLAWIMVIFEVVVIAAVGFVVYLPPAPMHPLPVVIKLQLSSGSPTAKHTSGYQMAHQDSKGYTEILTKIT